MTFVIINHVLQISTSHTPDTARYESKISIKKIFVAIRKNSRIQAVGQISCPSGEHEDHVLLTCHLYAKSVRSCKEGPGNIFPEKEKGTNLLQIAQIFVFEL